MRSLFTIALAICLTLAASSCARSSISECDLLAYWEAEGQGKTRETAAGVVSPEGGWFADGILRETFSFNAGVVPADACDYVTFETGSSSLKIGKTPGLWGESLTVPYDALEGGGFVYLLVETESDDGSVSDALRALGSSHLVATFSKGGEVLTASYTVRATEGYLAYWDDLDEGGYDGLKFLITKETR